MIKRSSSSRSTRSAARLSRRSNTSRGGPHHPSFEKDAASALESRRTTWRQESGDTWSCTQRFLNKMIFAHICFVIAVIYFLYSKFVTNKFLARPVGPTLPFISFSHKSDLQTLEPTAVMASRKSNNIPCNNIYAVASVEGDRTGPMTRSMLRSSGIDKDKYFISLETPEKSKSSTMGATSRVLYPMRLLNQNPTLMSSRVDVIQLERSERTRRIRLLQPWSTLW